MAELSKMGKTIFFSTHILADVADICTRVGIIEAGRLVAEGTLEELQKHLLPRRRIQVIVLGDPSAARATLEGIDEVLGLEEAQQQVDDGRTRLEFDFSGDDAALSDILTRLVSQGIPVIHFNSDSRDMEEVFMRATKGLVT
jgi:ABC-2 type transport system ATP-binding protein